MAVLVMLVVVVAVGSEGAGDGGIYGCGSDDSGYGCGGDGEDAMPPLSGQFESLYDPPLSDTNIITVFLYIWFCFNALVTFLTASSRADTIPLLRLSLVSFPVNSGECSLQCSVCSDFYTLCTVQCAVCSMRFSVCSVQCLKIKFTHSSPYGWYRRAYFSGTW